MIRHLFALCCLSCAILPVAAAAERTKLMEVDLETGRRRRIDARSRGSSADRELDAMLGQTMGQSFTTAELERVDKALRRYLKMLRPRASARLLVFLYPGRITRSALSELREVLVDLDLVVDPCGRSFCEDAVGKHLDLVGRSLKQAVIRTRRYSIRFNTITVRTALDPGSGYQLYRFTTQQILGLRGRGGAKLVRKVARQRAGYDRKMLAAVQRQLKLRRLRVARVPRISRSRQSVSANLELRSDRVRYRAQAVAALLATAKALAASPLTPPNGELTVVARVRKRREKRYRFHCSLQSLRLHLAGRMSRKELLASYVVEDRPGGRRLTFDDAEAAGRAPVEEALDGPDQTNEILAAHFDRLAPCLQAEARRNRRFRGVTLQFSVTAEGRASGLRLKERRASVGLRRCLDRALRSIRFARHRGPPRGVSYPMMIQR
jgi:hypothetical protein